eukprot:8535977-Heterocapsa_arctica.AAC.1
MKHKSNAHAKHNGRRARPVAAAAAKSVPPGPPPPIQHPQRDTDLQQSIPFANIEKQKERERERERKAFDL